jgi:hypothetical protein
MHDDDDDNEEEEEEEEEEEREQLVQRLFCTGPSLSKFLTFSKVDKMVYKSSN